MFQSLPLAVRCGALAALLTGAALLPAQAQFSYSSGNATKSVGTYTPLGATATDITVANNDDANSAPQAIGFPFSYNGQSFTQFVFNTNGFIKLGATAPSATDLYYTDPQAYASISALESVDPLDVNIIAPFNYDLEPGTGAVAFRTATTGTAPNRVCTIEWANVADKFLTVPQQLANFSFQVKLYEAASRIEFVYGPATATTNAFAFLGVPSGLTGADPTTEVLVASKASAQGWLATAFQNTPYSNTPPPAQNRLNIRNTVLPAAGLTFRFNATQANDINVAEIYSLGRLPIPFAVPHTVTAVVINSGANLRASLPVTLTVSGVTTFTNTQTLTNVAPGDTVLVTFAPYSATTTGTNTLTVSVPADDNTSNDSRQWMQEVTNDRFRYADNGPASGGVGYNTGSGLIAVKHNTTQDTAVVSARIYLEGAATVGRTVFAAVLDGAGTILSQTANYVVTAADTGSYKTFTFPVAPTITPGDFFVALGQLASTTGYFPVGTQEEAPMRADTYFAIGLMGGAGTDFRDFDLTLRPMIEVVLGAPAACQVPTNVAVTNPTATGATVTFTTVPGALNYTIYYGAPGFTPGGAGSQTVTATTGSANLTGLATSTGYDVYVRTNCSATSFSTNVGPISFSTTCMAPVVSTFPYTFNFDTPAASQQLQCGVSVVDVNSDGFMWGQLNQDTLATIGGAGIVARSAPNFMGYVFNAASAANDWFFLPAIQVPAGQQVRATWWQASTPTAQIWPERLEVKWGTAPTVAAMTNTIYPATTIRDTVYVQATSQPITGTGTVYVGFHCLSLADQYVLRIDDITFDRVTGVNNPALARAVGVYPNPSTGLVNVSLTETGATRVALRVLDNLGRVVYTGSMHDNAVKSVDLGHLANGMYTVQVNLDDQVVTKSVSVLK